MLWDTHFEWLAPGMETENLKLGWLSTKGQGAEEIWAQVQAEEELHEGTMSS